MKNKVTSEDRKRLIEEIKAKQENTVWPGPITNSRSVDEFLWRGDPDAPLVQRMAAWIFGITFTMIGIGWLIIAHDKHWVEFGVLSIAWFLLGGKVFLNGFNRHKSKKP